MGVARSSAFLSKYPLLPRARPPCVVARWRRVHELGRPQDDGWLSTHPREERLSTAPSSWRRCQHRVWVRLIPTPMTASASSCTSLRNLSYQAHRATLLYKEAIFLVARVAEISGCMPKKPSTAIFPRFDMDLRCNCNNYLRYRGYPPT